MIANVFEKRWPKWTGHRSEVKETLRERNIRSCRSKTGQRAREKKKADGGVSSALRMIQTVVGGIGVYFPSIMHHLFAGGRGNMSSWAS